MTKEILIKFLKKHKKANKVAAHHFRMLENMPEDYFEDMQTEDNEEKDMNKHYAGKYVKGMFNDEEFAKSTLGKNWKKLQAGLTSSQWRKNLQKLEV